MARESQGLQVLLIVFVMLTVVLGVTTYLYNKRADEMTKAAAVAANSERDAQGKAAEKQKECDVLKTLIGFPERSTPEIKKQFDEDMQTYGGEQKADSGTEKAGADKPLFDASTLYYSRLLASMYKVIQDRTDELVRSRAQYASLQADFKIREGEKDEAIKGYTEGYGKLKEQFAKIAEDYNSGLAATATEGAQVVSQVAKIKKKAADDVTKAGVAEQNSRSALLKKEAELKELLKKQAQVERPEMDVPSGEITWVSLANKMVWINRGRADALQRQTKFTVYSAESTNAAKAVKKGTVEVVRIDGDHSSEARILDDKLADPIMAGDKVFTPLWSPGQQNHFALAGIMDLDGDGRNQLSVVHGMINENGGVVDCWLDEHGHKQGQITANTRFIVVGDPPDKGSSEFKKNYDSMLSDALHYEVRKMMLPDFKQQMGYQKSSSVEHFGGAGAMSSGVGRAASPAAAPKTGGAEKAPAKGGDDGDF